MAHLYNDGIEIFEPFDMMNKKHQVFEDAGGSANGGGSAAANFAAQHLRAQGMQCVLAWIDANDFSCDSLDAIITGMADLDESGDISADEEAYYNDLYVSAADAMAYMGGNPDDIAAMLNDDDDDAAGKVGAALSNKMDASNMSDADIISGYATDAGSDAVLESLVKVVRGGEMVMVKKRKRKHHQLTAAQKAGLMKAGAKSHSGMAKLARAKSMKIRKKFGMRE